MTTVLLVVHIMAAFSMIVLILLQRSEGGALGMGGGGGGFVTGRAAANLLTKITAIARGRLLRDQPCAWHCWRPPGAPTSARRRAGPERSRLRPRRSRAAIASRHQASHAETANAAPAQPQLPQSK